MELRQRFDELIGLANATDGSGQYLFSGYMGDTVPFAGAVAGGVAYAGDDGQRLLQVSASRQVALSDSGNDIFMRIRNGNGTFATSVAAGNSGSGVIDAGSVAGSFVADTYTISFTPSGSGLDYTVTGVSSGVVATGAYRSGEAISFNGASVVITGTPHGGDTFQVAPSGSQSMFATLASLIAALEAPAAGSGAGALLANRIGFALRDLDQAEENLLRVRASIGARHNEIDSLANAGEDMNLNYAQTLSRLRELDYAEALTRLTQQQMTLEAAQKTFVSVSGLSLFNHV
jgi:flagellar hook-associated protein 3 FlgL